MTGYGGNWGGAPWGGAESETSSFDVLCFSDCTQVSGILSASITTTLGDGEQFQNYYPAGGSTCDLGLLSGKLGDSSFSTRTAVLQLEPESGLQNKWTLECVLRFYDLPLSFDDLINHHLYIGVTNSVGPVGGLFFSSAGIAYAGDTKHTGPNNSLVLNGPVEPLPNTAVVIEEDVYMTLRMSVDGDSGLVYLYLTPSIDVLYTGHRLVAVLPALGVTGLPYAVTDRVLLSVKGTTLRPSIVAINQLCMSSMSLVPNMPPVADAGPDQAARLCSILRLDGSASFDPEGVPLTYDWRLIDAPLPSSFVFAAYDGATFPLTPATGFTHKLYSAAAAAEHGLDPVLAGDVLNVLGAAYDVVTVGTDGGGFYVAIAGQHLPQSLVGVPYKILRQRGVSNPQGVKPTFLPDVTGFFKFDLRVSDGVLLSAPAVVVANIVESVLPRGITPDLSFIFSYLSDFWDLVEGKEKLSTFWSSLAQVAASELWTLWQLEYSKSLRDIQRTFTRRWLHYDLLLAEPVPELTRLRLVSRYMLSTVVPPSGVAVVGTLQLSIPALGDSVVKMLSTGLRTAAQAAEELSRRLQQVDPRFTVDIVPRRDGNSYVRIIAPFDFSFTASTSALFPSESASISPNGTGSRVGPRSYRVGACLQGLGLQENDLLVLDGEAYLIASITDDPSDTIPYQRVNLKADIPLVASTSWAISSYVTSELLNFYNGLVTSGDYVYFEVASIDTTVASTRSTYEVVVTNALGAVAGASGVLAFDVAPFATYLGNGAYTVRLAKVLRRTYVPVDARVLEVPTLVATIQMQDDSETLHLNLDYYREEHRGLACLRFESGSPDVWEMGAPPERLWAEYTYLDNRELIEGSFGIPAEFTLDDLSTLPGNVDYLSAVRGLWYAFFGGPTLHNLRVGSQILLGLPFAEERGVIEEIRTDFSPSQGRLLIRDADHIGVVRSYTFVNGLELEVNPATGKPYVVGDTVQQFAPLVRGVEIVDWVSSPTWMWGLVNQGAMYEVEKFYRFLVRVDSKAFNLAALLFARGFILKIKPRYCYPLFVVRKDMPDTEVNIVDIRQYKVKLRLDDAFCQTYSSYIYDDVRSGGGGQWNQFDNQQGTSLPTPFTPDLPIDWGYDRFRICPADDVEISVCKQHSGGVPTYDSVWSYDEGTNQRLETSTNGPFTIPTGSTGTTLTPSGTATVALASSVINRVAFLATGGPGASPTNYELVVTVNGVTQLVIPFTATASYTDFSAAASVSVTSGDTIGLRVRHSDGSSRSPSWTNVRAYVDVQNAFWAYDVSLPAAKYCGIRVVSDEA